MHLEGLAQGLALSRHTANDNHYHHHHRHHVVKVLCEPWTSIRMWSGNVTILPVSSGYSALDQDGHRTPHLFSSKAGLPWSGQNPFGFFEFSGFIWPNTSFLRVEEKASSRSFLQQVGPLWLCLAGNRSALMGLLPPISMPNLQPIVLPETASWVF